MKITFGFFVSKPIESFIKKIELELSAYCDIIYLPAVKQNDISSTYHSYKSKVDGFVFSGSLMYYLFLEKNPSPNKPCFYLDELKTDIKDIFLKLLLKNRTFDFSRTFIDMATGSNQYLGIKEILRDNPLPYFNEFDYEDPVSFERKIIDRHIELHKAGLIDLSITRLGNCLDELESHGIPYIYAYPPLGYTINFFMKAINQINLSKAKNQILGTIVITLENTENMTTSYSNKIQLLNCCNLITTYAQLHGYDFTLYEEEPYIEILTHLKDISKITKNFKICHIKKYIEETLGKNIILGLGTGHNIYKARHNAYEAAKISIHKGEGPFYISYDDKIMGPLSGKVQIYDTTPSPKLLTWSKKLHVDHVNLQKIIAFTKMSETTNVTSDALAEYLNISLRSANRLLTKISENQGAITYYQNIDGRPGRPKKCFNLTFIDKLGDIKN